MSRPMNLKRAAAVGSAIVLSVALSGCITLLPKSKPAQLYRFGITEPSSATADGGGTFGVLRAGIAFQREAAGDRLLSVTGTQAAYIAEARWVSPANVLFDEAVGQAFASDPGPARLVGRGDARKADYALRLEVRSFEVRYTRGAKAAPDVVIEVDAALTRVSDRSLVKDKPFVATIRASDNRVGAIVEAYNSGIQQILPDLAKWVDAAGPDKE